MECPRLARQRQPPPSLTPQSGLPTLAALGLPDEDAVFDPDWYPAALAAFAFPPSRWRVLRRPLGVGAGMMLLMAIVLLVLLPSEKEPDGDDAGMPPVAIAPGLPAVTPTVIPAGVGGGAVASAEHPRPVQRGGDNQFRQGGDNQYVASTAVPTPAPVDDPVLIWWPEILAAAEETGVSPSLIAAVIRVESQGDPLAMSPHGARGLMQVMPEHLVGRGVPEHQWHDPATNIMVGARLLGWNIETSDTQWDGIAQYFGDGCDGFSCTDAYVSDVLSWEAYYAPLIASDHAAFLSGLTSARRVDHLS